MIKNIVVPYPKRIERLKKKISKEGKEKLHVLSDFDRTLTKAVVERERVPSLISVLYSNGEYLSDDYARKSQDLQEKYYPIEVDPGTPIEEKKKAMQEWWISQFKLLIKSGLNKKHLVEVINSPRIRFRKGALDFFDFLKDSEIPLIIMSSSGLGGDIIEMMLQKERKLFSNIHIVSNSFLWDDDENAIDFETPIIHVFNKDETLLKKFPFYSEIEKRKNVLLLGDSLGDTGIVEGFDYSSLIKIGFLNEKVDENLKKYKEAYDILILHDSSMDYVNSLLKEITQTG